MRKFLSVLLGVALVGSLSACYVGSEYKGPAPTLADEDEVREECIEVGEDYLEDLFDFSDYAEFDKKSDEREYWVRALDNTIYDDIEDDDFDDMGMYFKCLPDLGTDEAKAYVLSCIADTAVITPGEMKLLKDESVRITYEVTVVPGKDVFAKLESEDIWLWLSNSYDMDKGEYIKVNDNAKPEVKNVIDSIEPVTTTFTITYSKTDDGYKAETEPQNVANAIFSLSSDSVS